jgi:DsbC/DsbD-like thiol-disulfide interchange protein
MREERFRFGRAVGRVLSILAAPIAMSANVHADPPGLAPGPPGQADVPAEPEDPGVRAKIAADVRSVQPGKPFRVGMLLEMKPGWHVYWRNPGDAGLATSVEFVLPKGFSAGPLRWPIPDRFEEAGDITSFGYEKSVLLWAQITPPKKLRRGGQVRIGARASWLGCKVQCVPGEAELELKLAVTEDAEADNAALFAQWQRRLPWKAGSAEAGVAVRVSGSAPTGPKWQTIRIELAWQGRMPAKIEWFPGHVRGLELGKPSMRTVGRKTEISVPVRAMPGQEPSARTLRCLVAYSRPDGVRRAVEVVLRRPGEAPAQDRKPKTNSPGSGPPR